MKNLEKIARGLGLAVEVIIVVEFTKEVYQYFKPKVKKCLARWKDKKETENPLEEPIEGGTAEYEPAE